MSNYKNSLNLTVGDTFVLGMTTYTVKSEPKTAEAMAYTRRPRIEFLTDKGVARVVAGIPVKIVSNV